MIRHLHDRAIKLVDHWVLDHCVPDRIVLTQGASANLADMISVALHETAGELLGPPDPLEATRSVAVVMPEIVKAS
jgi:hypothetical protein